MSGQFLTLNNFEKVHSSEYCQGRKVSSTDRQRSPRSYPQKVYNALKKYRMNRSITRKRKLRSISQQTKFLVRRKHQEYLAKIEGSFCDNPKLFWSYHKAILHHRAAQNHKITYNGVTAKTAKERSNIFNTYFSSVFRPPSTCSKSDICDLPQPSETVRLSNITLDVEEVIAQRLSYLDISKSCGPDGIPPRLLQECSFQIAPSICDLFNHSHWPYSI